MWNIEDRNGFDIETKNGRGQINIDQKFGKLIFDLASLEENKVFLDIGTWNGLGSTKCFIEAMKVNKNSTLYTVENNSEKIQSAQLFLDKFIKEYELDVHFLNGTFIDDADIDKWISENNIQLSQQQKYWLDIDKSNSASKILSSNFDKIDILLIDGSDYSGYLELLLFKDISKYIMLDDVNSLKNMMSRDFLLNSDDFELIADDLSDRNGYSVFKKK
jgi:hypothetical protein